MTLHRLTRTIWVSPGHALRIGRLEITAHPYGGYISVLWYRRNRTNHVGHLKYRKPKSWPQRTEYITVYHQLPRVDRNLDPAIANHVGQMLDTYCVWLNKHLDHDPFPSGHRYTPTQFLDHDPEKGLYGSTYIAAIFNSDYHQVVALNTDDGDDGGGHSLTGWFAEWAYPSYYTELQHMTQEFDTMLTEVLNEGELVFHPTYHKEPQ